MHNLFTPECTDRVIVFDTETSGLGNGSRILEFTAISVEKNRPVDQISTLVHSVDYISPRATAIHGIDISALQGQPSPRQVYPILRSFIGNSPVVGHNVVFDKNKLNYELWLLGMPPLTTETFCTLALSRKKLPHLPNHKLKTVYEHLLGKGEYAAHRSWGDVMMTIAIYLCLKDQL